MTTLLGHEIVGWDQKPQSRIGTGRVIYRMLIDGMQTAVGAVLFPPIRGLTEYGYGKRNKILINGEELVGPDHGFIKDTNIYYVKKETDGYIAEAYSFGIPKDELLHAMLTLIVIKNKDLFSSSYPDLPSEPDSWTEPETEAEAQQHLVVTDGSASITNTTDAVAGNYAHMIEMTGTWAGVSFYFNADHSPIDLTHYNKIRFKWKWEGVTENNKVIIYVGEPIWDNVVYNKNTPNTDGYEEIELDISNISDRSSIARLHFAIGYGGSINAGATCKIDDLRIYSTANYEIEFRTCPSIKLGDQAQCEYDSANDCLKMYDARDEYPWHGGAYKDLPWKVLWLSGFTQPSTNHYIQGTWGKNSYDAPSSIGDDGIKTETGEMASNEIKMVLLYNIFAPLYSDGSDDAYNTLTYIKSNYASSPEKALNEAIDYWRSYLNSGIKISLKNYPNVTNLINVCICEFRASLDPISGHITASNLPSYTGVTWVSDPMWGLMALCRFMHADTLKDFHKVLLNYERNALEEGYSPIRHMVSWDYRLGGGYFVGWFRAYLQSWETLLNTDQITLDELNEIYFLIKLFCDFYLQLIETDPEHPIYGHVNHRRLLSISPPVGTCEGEGWMVAIAGLGSAGNTYACTIHTDQQICQKLRFASHVAKMLGHEEDASRYAYYADLIDEHFEDYFVESFKYNEYDGTLKNVYLQLIHDDPDGNKVITGYGVDPVWFGSEYRIVRYRCYFFKSCDAWYEWHDTDYLIELKKDKFQVAKEALRILTNDGKNFPFDFGKDDAPVYTTAQILNRQGEYDFREGVNNSSDIEFMAILLAEINNGLFDYVRGFFDIVENSANKRFHIFDEHCNAYTVSSGNNWYMVRGFGTFLMCISRMFEWKKTEDGYMIKIIPAVEFTLQFPDGTIVDVTKEGDDTKYLSSVILDGKPINTFEPQFKSALIPIKAGEKHTVKFIFSDDKPSSPSINYVDVLTKLKNVSYNSVFRVLSAELESPEIPQKIRFYVPKSLYPYKPYVEVSGAEVTYEKWDPENETLELKIVSHSPATITLYPDSITYYFLSGRMMFDLISITSLILIKEAISSVVNALKEGVS